MSEPPRYAKGEAPEDLDDNITLDANDDRWEWRRRIRANPASHRAYRTVVAVLGLWSSSSVSSPCRHPGPDG